MSELTLSQFEEEVWHAFELRNRIKLAQSIDITKKDKDLELEIKLWRIGQLQHWRFWIVLLVSSFSHVLSINLYEIFTLADNENVSQFEFSVLLGIFFGIVLSTLTLDCFGRVNTMRVATVICLISILLSFIDNLTVFNVCSFVMGATTVIIKLACFILLIDYSSQQSLCFAGLMFYSFNGIIFVLLGLGTYIFPNNYFYRRICWAWISLLEFICIWILMPESIRLHLGHNNKYKAWQIMCKLNKDNISTFADTSRAERLSRGQELKRRFRLMLEIFSEMEFVKRALLLCLIAAFLGSLMLFNVQNIIKANLLASDLVMRHIILGVCQSLFCVFAFPLYHIFGRKLGVEIIYSVTTILAISLPFVDDSSTCYIIILLLLILNQVAFAALSIMVAESFPTNSRGFVISVTYLINFLGALLCKVINDNVVEIYENNIYNILTNVGPLVLVPMLPPTTKRFIVNNFEDAKLHYIQKRKENTGPRSILRWIK